MDITCAGTSLTNYIGFDSVWRMGIAYSGENGFRPCGSPPNLPWTASPMAAVTMIVLPGDTSITYVPAGSFTYFVNDESIIGIPTVDTQFNNYMRAKIRNGTHISDDFVGPGTQTKGYGAGPDCGAVVNPKRLVETLAALIPRLYDPAVAGVPDSRPPVDSSMPVGSAPEATV